MNPEFGQTLPNSASAAGADLKVVCPRCGELRGSRVKRKGFMQKQVMPFFGYFPWQCGACRHQWNSKIRGEKKRRRVGRGPKAYIEPSLAFQHERPSAQIPIPIPKTPLLPIDNSYRDDTHEDVE